MDSTDGAAFIVSRTGGERVDGKLQIMRLIGQAEHLVLAGLILTTLYWVYDIVVMPHGHGISIDLLLFGLQLALILIAWRLVRRRQQMERELEQAMGRLAEEKNRSEAIIAALGDGISIQSPDFRVLYQNEAHRRLVGGDCLGELCYQVYARRDQICDGCPVEAAFADGAVHRLEKVNQPGRSSTHLEIVATPLRDANGRTTAGIELVRDISPHKQAEEALARQAAELAVANEELEGFSYSLSHDLRSPLTRIYAAAQLLSENSGRHGSELEQHLVKTIWEASEKMEELIEAILALSHVSRAELLHEEVDLSAIARETEAQLRLTNLERRATVDVAAGLKVSGDPRLLRVLLENLLENAWKYTQKKEEARIEMGCREEGGRKIYFVRDNGAGFDMALAARIFKPFQRLHQGSEYAGTGVGLATVQRIVQRHGGEVWAEGSPGRGATFYFTLP